MDYDYYLKMRLKEILPLSVGKILTRIYKNIQDWRFLLLHQKIARIVKDTPFNPKAVFPSDFKFENSGLSRLVACGFKDKYPIPIGIVQIKSRLTKKALKEMYSFAKKGGKFVAIPMFSGIPTKQQVKICSFTGYTTLEPIDYLKQIPHIPLGMTDFLPIGRFNLKAVKKEYDFFIITWARDIYHKRWDIVLKLIEELCPKHKMVVLAYRGKPNKRDLAIIKRHEASGQLKFINQWVSKEEFPILMQNCKVLIVPSEKDNQPKILDQALLLNVPLAVNENLYGGKKLISERTGKLSSADNLAKYSEEMLQNLAGKTETRSWYLQHFGPYNATRQFTTFINKIFGTDYRLVCVEDSEFMFTSQYINSIVGLPENYQDLRIEEPNSKVSVIMAVFNGQKYIEESIKSILEQTFRNFEFIIVNDGSTDRTKEILLDWAKKDNRIKIITNPNNIGLTKSLNKAINMAQGKYIARQDADDISLPQRLEKQVVFLENHPEIKILGTFGYAINKEGKVLREEILPVSSQKIKNMLIKKNPFIHASVMIKKEIIDKVGGYNEDFKVIQDYELWFRILRVARGENLPLFLVKKRYQPEMISFKNNKEQLRQRIALKKEVIKRGDYPKFCYIYLLRSYLSLVCPTFLKIFINKHFLRRGIF